jgi:hypothetical protein
VEHAGAAGVRASFRVVTAIELAKHLVQRLQNFRNRLRSEPSQTSRQPTSIHCPNLVDGDEARPALKATRHTPRVGAPGG